MAKQKSIKEGVEIMNRSIEENMNPVKTINTARRLSSDPVYNLTCFLMADYGVAMKGMSEQDWKREAKIILKIVKS